MFALEEVMLADFTWQLFPCIPFERIDATLTQKSGSSWLLLPLEVSSAPYVGTTALTARASSLSHSLATTGSRESERPS